MKTYLVPFTEKEKVLINYIVKVEAKSKEEAYDKIIKIIDENESPHTYYDSDNNGIAEHLDSCCHFDIEPFNEDDIEIVDDRISCELSLTAFDIAKYGNTELYSMAEEVFSKVGLNIDIHDMDMIPIKIEAHFVTYDCIPKDYANTLSDGEIFTFINNKEVIKEEIMEAKTVVGTIVNFDDLEIVPLLVNKSCSYDRRTLIMLPDLFPIAKLDEKLCDNKSDVVKYNGQTYICGILDDGYALWMCEV